jgi:hypothetical protein
MTAPLPDLRLERARPSDPPLDFCLWPYSRPAPPQQGALRSSALLHASFALAGAPAMAAVAEALQRRLGRFATVYGVKWAAGRMSWEFYLYDYARWERRLGAVQLAEALEGVADVRVRADEATPYFMVSVELGSEQAAGSAPVETLDLYMGLPDSQLSAGACYGLTRQGLELRNIYHFFDAARREDALALAFASPRFDARRVAPEALFWPEMAGARSLVVASKRWCDGLYFSRIGVDALIAFLRRAEFPSALTDFALARRDALSHHLFDVGYDHAVGPDGRPRILKGSFYGLL